MVLFKAFRHERSTHVRGCIIQISGPKSRSFKKLKRISQYLCFIVLLSNTLTKVIRSVSEGLCQDAVKVNVKQPKIRVELFRSWQVVDWECVKDADGDLQPRLHAVTGIMFNCIWRPDRFNCGKATVWGIVDKGPIILIFHLNIHLQPA